MSTEPSRDLTTNVVAFCGVLRGEHDFRIGNREAHDALRALDIIGVNDRDRVRSALRLICCGTRAQTLVFDRAFDAFFLSPSGLPQPAHVPRHTRPGRDKPQSAVEERHGADRKKPDDAGNPGRDGNAVERRPAHDPPDGAAGWQMLRAHYSPTAALGLPLRVDTRSAAALRPAAEHVIRSVRLGRSRRWKALEGGGRFDIRRTIRAGLATGGDLVEMRFLGHPLRNPRFVVLIDGSRSMAEHTSTAVAFAAALCDRAARTTIFFFSTALRDVTEALRAAMRGAPELADLGTAWGGGTKIGTNLASFVGRHGSRLLSPDTLVLIFSDGLDVGDIPELERAMREIDRRSAGVVWLNPHAALPGYTPTARGMRAALPNITLLCAANDARGFEELARRIARSPSIRGRRR